MVRIKSSTVVKQADGLVAVEMDDELVMLSVASGRYYGLDEVAARIWPLLAQPCPVSEVCSALLDTHEVTRERLESDVLSFLGVMAEQGLIEVVGEVDSAVTPDLG